MYKALTSEEKEALQQMIRKSGFLDVMLEISWAGRLEAARRDLNGDQDAMRQLDKITQVIDKSLLEIKQILSGKPKRKR